MTRWWPGYWPLLEAQLSAVATLLMKDVNSCLSLFAVGASGAGKGTTLRMFTSRQEEPKEGQQPLIEEQDDFTIKAFLSHFAEASDAELEQRSLAVKLKHRVMLTTELSPIFGGARDKNEGVFSTLAQVLDGEGKRSTSGAHQTLGKKGDYTFVWLGGTTPFRLETWKTMARLGTRLLFYRVPDGAATVEEEAYATAERECREAVNKYLEGLFKGPHGQEDRRRSLPWPNLDPIRTDIRRLAALCALGQSHHAGNVSEDDAVRPEPNQIRQRLMFHACGRAIIHGRDTLTADDLPMIRKVVESSMPGSRGPILLSIFGGKDTLPEIAKETGLTHEAVRKAVTDVLVRADIVKEKTEGGGRVAGQWIINWPEPWKTKQNGLDHLACAAAAPEDEDEAE